ncbi:hypothetical protein [Streptomyces bluensis]|uniref:hypothetical protein n=1 Tax=Streptomyces bluensis TaxID=33897 RepID=UPI003327C5EC
MAEHQYTPEELALLGLNAQLLALSDDTTVAGRFILLGTDGRIVANGSLSDRDVAAATEALACLIAARKAMQESTGPAVYDRLPKVQIDPLLENELEEYCIGLDTQHLVEMAKLDPKAAVAAFDEITSDTDGNEAL